jgi:RND family efflux transporter MFP subunit
MIKRFLAPVIVLVVGVGLAALIIASGPKLEPQAPPSSAPLVRIWEAASQSVQLTSITHGTVLPRTESDLIPEVSGRIISISKSMVSGGFFKKNDLLLVIDPLDYEVAREQARAGLASAGSELSNAKKGHDRQLDLALKQSTSQSKKDDALNRLRFAQASLREAKARLSRAERDLSRTKITAPYDGRIRSERVDIGQFVNRGTSMATLYATDIAEVRLPIHDEELAHLALPLANQIIGQQRPEVILRAQFAGQQHTWRGAIVRTEGEIDPKTRMITVVAQVESPYETENDRPPLAVGLFVRAEIIGHKIGNVFVLPRSAIQANRQVYVIGKDNRLQFRDVEILRTVGEEVYITEGLNARETVCLSTVSNAIEGMLVQPAPTDELQASK